MSHMDEQLSSAMNAMNIGGEIKPFVITDDPKYSSKERNILSLMGRLLNPAKQRRSKVTWALPKEWRLFERARGVAVSPTDFRFFFRTEEEMMGVLTEGAWLFDDWNITLERWVEEPPDDFLRILPLWIKIFDIPVNNRTEATIEGLAGLVGQVTDVIFDPEKPNPEGFERARILFDVANPLMNRLPIQVRSGKIQYVRVEYERTKRRCFQCQRLTHDKSRCPVFLNAQKDLSSAREESMEKSSSSKELVIGINDPLFGVLTEEQVGINPVTKVPNFDKETLDEMRQYLLIQDPTEKKAREFRVQKKVKKLLAEKQGQNLLPVMISPGALPALDSGVVRNTTSSVGDTLPRIASENRAANTIPLAEGSSTGPREDLGQSSSKGRQKRGPYKKKTIGNGGSVKPHGKGVKAGAAVLVGRTYKRKAVEDGNQSTQSLKRANQTADQVDPPTTQ